VEPIQIIHRIVLNFNAALFQGSGYCNLGSQGSNEFFFYGFKFRIAFTVFTAGILARLGRSKFFCGCYGDYRGPLFRRSDRKALVLDLAKKFFLIRCP
jgi:hypothetical protein